MANVFSLERTFKVVGTDGRIRGEWVVVLPKSGEALISPHEVVLWDEQHSGGIVLNRHDLSARVRDGVAELSIISSLRQDDVAEVRDELLELLVEIARVAKGES